jgi:PAS domain S-box-containing protein
MPALAAMVLLLLTGTGTLLYWQHRQQMDRDSTNVAADVSRDLSVALTQQTADLAAAAQTIAAELPVQEALREKDDRRLLAFGQPVFEALRLKNHISHFYFFDPNRVCLLRLHKPDKKGDRIERFTALEAERTGKPASGIELGTMGNLTLRMVQPVYAGGALVGYVEVGKEIEDTLQEMHPWPGVQLAVSVRKEFLSRPTWEEGMRMLRAADWDRFPGSVLIYASHGRLPDGFAPLAAHDGSGRPARGEPDRQLAFAGRHWRGSAMPLKDASGKGVGEVWILCDISEAQAAFEHLVVLGGSVGGAVLALLLGFIYVILRRTDRLISAQERGLKENEHSYRNQFTNNSAVMLLIEPADGTIIEANAAAVDFYGYPRERLLTLRITDICTRPEAEALQSLAAVHAYSGQRLEAQHRLADGSVRYVETCLSRIPVGGRTVLHAIIQDISEQKRMADALADEAVRRRILIEDSSDGIVVFDQEGKVVEANRRFAEMLGYTAEEALRLHVRDWDFQLTREQLLGMVDQIDATGAHFETRHCRKDGTLYDAEISSSGALCGGRKLVFCVCRDITSRKQASTYREMGLNILQTLNAQGTPKEAIGRIIEELRMKIDLDAVGVRLQEGEDFPYFAQQGFPEGFMLAENTLAERGVDGVLCRDSEGHVCLECTCGQVVSGKSDPDRPLLTPGGSFWTNDSFPLLDLPAEQDPRHHPRNVCVHQGYGSVALIPLKDKQRIVGLIQLNARRKGVFTLAAVEFLEGIAAHIGAALMRMRVEERLREEEERFHTLADSGMALIWTAGTDKKCNYFNQVWLRFTGRALEQELGDGWAEGVHPDDLSRCFKIYTEAFDRRDPFSMDYRMRHHDGEFRWIQDVGTPRYNSRGIFLGYIGHCLDITDRKEAEEALQRTHNTLVEAQKIAHLGSFEYGAVTQTTVWSEEEYRIYGLDPAGPSPTYDEMLNTCVHPDDAALLHESFTKAMQSCSVYELDHRIVRPDGSVRWVYDLAYPYLDEQGKLLRYVGTTLDITSRKQSEAALLASEARLQAVFESTADGILAVDNNGKVVGANRRFADLWRVPQSLLESNDDKALLAFVLDHLCDPMAFQAKVQDLYNSDAADMDTLDFSDGRVFERYSIPLLLANRVAGRVWSFRDITARKRAEESLLESERRFRHLVTNTPAMIYTCRAYGDFGATFVSENVLPLLGYQPEEFTQQPSFWKDHIHPEDLARAFAEVEKALQVGDTYEYEYRFLRKDGTYCLILDRAQLIRTALGQPHEVIGHMTDITYRRRTEDELKKLDKLQSVGTLAGGIAHDFNNILLGLFGNISLAMDDLSQEHPSYAPLHEAEKSMSRAVRLTKQLLTFAKGGDPVKEYVSLGHMVEEVARFDLTGSNVSLVFHHDAALWPVDADKGQIQQVVSNLVINARQAMPKGGNLTINLENADLQAKAVSGLSEGRYVKVTVQDEGGGIDPKVLGQIFDPYFTTKQTGSGLGLATVWSIINKHGGHIGVVSELGKGTAFTFYLPASTSSQPAEVKTLVAESPAPTRPAKILVMDDEKMVCTLASKILTPCGYTVASAPDAQEAVALYRQALETGVPFDLVIMDLTIPGGPGGKEVIQDLLALDPHVRAIVSSGYADDPVMSSPAKYGFKGTVAKPYTARALREAVARALE